MAGSGSSSPSAPRPSVEEHLAREGHRLTGPRRAVLDVLAASDAPLSVADIHRRLGDGRANVVSVYRTVNLLIRMRLVRHTDTGRTGSRYELAEEFTGHHHHLICDRCGRIEDVAGCLVPDAALAQLNQRMLRSRQFRVTAHELRLFGLCRSCDQ